MHITAGVFINDEESGIKQDILDMLDSIAPFGGFDGKNGAEYRHHRTGEDNGDAHLKNILTGHHVMLPVTNGRLDLGPWQQVFYAEFDGMRQKRLIIKIIGE
jgi:secondary thiamine-phosphate synthase enzyme